ncbi:MULTISPECIES: SRPBCC family protein [Sphingobium]|jgi:hypothetical protein|uniref:SRPBCC family protein n=1 Tax=Sphingobium TaxID=165695 RepID=UPI0003A689C8|nr:MULTISPECIES: SRPBCC family protein [Sphingobium]MBU0555378.1 SRPBCC family protein [Alphaproteobacteria bacterium]AJR26706.1 hypothetical protein TZ53_22940 [Sphingobium sp. YBL2]AMK20203.1 hypothetical protein K663_19223 [Sphingobium sp. MI1205]MBU0793036.1 SRPBCC family protein [Alphaproteobacteria bacterium]MBU0877644.1 SRPBCC family protein [Alphaproteobacteria bacterium]
MKETTSFALTITPIRAWTHIVDLPTFALWHPSYRFRGIAAPDADVSLTFSLLKGELPLTAEAKIIAYERAHRLAWQTGFGGIFALREEYAFAGAGAQTQVRHTIAVEGVLSPLGYLARRGLRKTMQAQDAALIRYLTKEVRGNGLSVNRHRRLFRKTQLARKTTQ